MTTLVTPLARALVRRRVEAAMTAQVTILRGALGALDPATGMVGGLSASAIVYQGKARVHTVVGQGVIAVAAGEVDQRQASISIPWDAPTPARDDIVQIDSNGPDTELAGQAWRVLEVAGGTLFNDSCRISCTAWHRSRYWAPS